MGRPLPFVVGLALVVQGAFAALPIRRSRASHVDRSNLRSNVSRSIEGPSSIGRNVAAVQRPALLEEAASLARAAHRRHGVRFGSREEPEDLSHLVPTEEDPLPRGEPVGHAGVPAQQDAPSRLPKIRTPPWMQNESFLGKYGLLIIAAIVVVVPAGITFIMGQMRGVHLATLGGREFQGMRKPPFYERVFLAHRNHVFAADAELAVRSGVGCVLVALPMLLPETQYWIHSGRYGYDVAVMLVFTIYKSVGETMNYAFFGVCGVFFAALNAWLLNGFFPAGVTDGTGDLEWWIGMLNGVGFIVFILAFNFDLNLQMFALSWHVWFFMGYMNPSNNSFNTSFSLDVTGPAISALISSCIGAGMAIVVTMVPFPIFALDRARANASRITHELTASWRSSIECYCHSHKCPILEDDIYSTTKRIDKDIATLAAQTSNSWWECFGIGSPQKVRIFLEEMRHVFIEMQARLMFVLDVCKREGFEQSHVELMSVMRPHLDEVSSATTDLMEFLVVAAADGSLSQAETDDMMLLQKKVNDAVKSMTVEFHACKTDFNYELLGEHAFCMAFCAYGRMAVDFAGVLHSEIAEDAYAPRPRFEQALNLMRLRDPIVFNCFLRNVLSIHLAFLLGYWGYSAAIPSYNAAPSCTASLLLSTGLGASMSKNLQRLQGVVMGTVIGQLAYAFLAWCSVFGYISVGVFVFMWCGMTLFVYYNSKTFSLMGCLLAAFGAKAVLKGCSNDVYEALGIWNQVIGCTLGILIMGTVDVAFSYKRPSQEAYDALMDAWGMYTTSLQKIFDPREENIVFQHVALRDKWTYAAHAGREAIAEPRFWRTEWKADLFHTVVTEGIKLHEALCNMECSFSQSFIDGGEKAQSLVQISELPAFKLVRKDMEQYFGLMGDYFDIFLHETEQEFGGKSKANLTESQDELAEAKEHVMELMVKITTPRGTQSTPAFKREPTHNHSLENDVQCKLATIVVTLENQLTIIFGIKHAILSE